MKKFTLISLYLCIVFSSFAKQHILNPDEVIDQAMAHWLDETGFLRLNPVGQGPALDNENPVLFTSEFVYMAKEKGSWTPERRETLKNWIKASIDTLEIEPGLYNRRPGDFGRHFSRDEHIGLLILDHVFDGELGYCKDLYNYGSLNNWIYQNLNYGGRRVFARDGSGREVTKTELDLEGFRQPGFVEMLRLCNGKEASYWGQNAISFALAVTMKRPHRDTSGKILAYFRLNMMKGKGRELDRASKKFHSHMKKQYKSENYISELFKIYFKNPEHPTLQLSNY